MNVYILILSLLLSFSILSNDFINNEKNLKTVKRLESIEIEKLWKLGHSNIESDINTFTDKSFQKFIAFDSVRYEQRPSELEVLSYLECLEQNDCHLYRIEVSSEHYGGWGFDYTIVQIIESSEEVLLKSYRGYQE